MGIKEKVFKRMEKEVVDGAGRKPTQMTLDFAEPMIDLTLSEVEKVIAELDNFAKNTLTEYSEGYSSGWNSVLKRLKLRLRGK